MIRYVLTCLMLGTVACSQADPSSDTGAFPENPLNRSTVHPKVDLDYWSKIFPLTTFERINGPRKFATTKRGDPLDLWKPRGEIITSPAHLCEVELVRKQYAESRDLGPSVPVDIFLWSIDPPEKPFLTKLGGTPHRESTKPWPSQDGKPCTFVAQFCFADSRDVVSRKLPGDVLLIFFKDANSLYDDSIQIEWSKIGLNSPLTAVECPSPDFTVPQLSGHIYRTNEYPESWEVFEQAGHYQYYLFPTTQSTKIGRETFFTQNDPRRPGEEFLCALNSVHPTTYPSGEKWPFIGLQALPDDWDKPDDHYGWGKYRMTFADVGCMYFLIDEQGVVTWSWDSY